MEPVLSVEGVSFRYGERWVLHDLDFKVRQGEILGILGPNACGKTTLVRLLDGIVHPARGRISLEGKDIRTLKRREIARHVAVVPQETPMLYGFSVMEVVLMGRNPHLSPLGFEKKEDVGIALRSLERTSCSGLSERDVNELSGGERQRVFIARALAQEPKVLLLDEPTVHLDLRHQMEFLDLLVTLNREDGITVVWVSHELNLAALACQRLLLMKGGRIHALGSPADVLTAANILEVYGRRVVVDTNPQNGAPRITPLIEAGDHRGRGGRS